MYLISVIVLLCATIISVGRQGEAALFFAIVAFIVALIGLLQESQKPTKY